MQGYGSYGAPPMYGAPSYSAQPVAFVPQASLGNQVTVYVGKIAPGIEDIFMRKLLETCGPIAQWKRMNDPETGRPKPFGFCTYYGEDSALRALTVLNGVTIGDREVFLKVEDKVQAQLAEYVEKHKETEMARKHIEDATRTVVTKLVEQNQPNLIATAEAAKAAERREARGKPDLEEINRQAMREKEREEREEREKIKREKEREAAIEREIKDRERNIARVQEDIERERSRYAELQNQREKERQRIAKDTEYFDSKYDSDYEERYRRGRRGNRTRQRERELQDDEEDVRREADEFQREQIRQQEMQREAERQAQFHTERLMAEAATQQQQQQQQLEMQQAPPTHHHHHLHPSYGGTVPHTPGTEEPRFFGHNATRLKSVFREEDEETSGPMGRSNRMKLIPIEYSAAEMASVADVMKDRQKREALEAKQIIDSLPKDKAGLYAWQIKWDILEKADVVEAKLRAWVAQKVKEYLGTEEKDLIQFILDQLRQRLSPELVSQNLLAVMEDEADLFVVKLWRKLIFEQCMAEKALERNAA